MDKKKQSRAIIIGDSTNNTLSIVRSLGEAEIPQVLILKCEEDICFVAQSKYLKHAPVFQISSMDECMPLLEQLKGGAYDRQYIICSFDEAAVYIDAHEPVLYPHFITPARGRQLGNLFDKDAQCRLAAECGLTVPKSMVYHRSEAFPISGWDYPLLLKPLNSTKGEKGDIHICQHPQDVQQALQAESHCEGFVIQEFIDKEYEIDCIGVRTDAGMVLAGGIQKIRHFPPLIGAGAYGLFKPIQEYSINLKGLELFLEKAGYYGPFSVEFLHKGDKDYFMEVNFRNEGLAYAATAAGANLHALYVHPELKLDWKKVHRVYMMNYSLDFLYVKNKELSLATWVRDFLRTRCFININWKDLNPIICYYKQKFKRDK